MLYSETYSAVASNMDAQRQQMNAACITNLATLGSALLAACPTIGAVFWYQGFNGQGFSLDNISFVGPDQVALLESDINPAMFMGTPADQGPAELTQFVQFLQTMSYHLYRVHGANVVVILTVNGFRAVPQV